MRLNPQTLQAIQQAVSECFAPGATVCLSGSHLYDGRRGEDIDLLISLDAAFDACKEHISVLIRS